MKSRILVNHVGLLPQAAKHFVICDPPEQTFTIIRVWNGEVVYRGELRHVNAELGDAWVGDFSSLQSDGSFLLHCGNLVSRPVLVHKEVYDTALRVLLNYFQTQRCGDSLTGWNAPCHLDDARRADTGEHLDVVGGWHQSGDLRKWMFGTPLGLSGLSQLGLLRNPRWDQGQIADELRWGNSYFHKMIRPDGGLMDHVVVPTGWSGREVYPNDPPPYATYLTIIGQALAARYLADRDPAHSRKCLDAARRIWAYITGPSAPSGPYKPPILPLYHDWLQGFFNTHCAPNCGDALYAAIKLFEATEEASFLEQACSLANDLVELQVGGDIETDLAAACFYVSPDRKALAASTMFGPLGLAELLMLQPNHPDAPRWKRAVELIAEQKCRLAERNPWGLIPSYWRANTPGAGRPAGTGCYRYFLCYRSPNGGEIKVGPNGDISTAALFLLRAHRLTGEARYLAAAQRQLDWILGCNPFDASTVEGVGLNQPLRYINDDEFFPPTPQIPGAVTTGIMGDDNDNPEPFGNNCSAEYDMPVVASLMWLLSEMTSGK